ncbi:hypothetical protein ARAM_002520 [Aspergillus rambellii]|uniref:Sof1-like protein domain-containing protein n=1 Tax=Aspergillus rambellii TaxID=308745 RepID=A0A0F8X1S7_9EURO|nr:hypothetical protein ARAM_002520 [Aspergillus rambellii]
MKIKALSRSAASQQAPGSGVVRQPRNLDPSQHPFERAREYTRALNAVKMERLFAAPFLGQMGEGHVDGVYTMAKDPGSLQRFASGSGDGVVKVWDLTTRGEVWNTQAHENIVKGTSILASTAIDRSIILYDLRTSSPLSKLVLKLASNAISWNPMEAFNFAVANEDHNVYMFDMRKMDRALNVLKDHVAAVMDVDFSPTGEELVTASYDKTVRLWNRATGHSRDIYHTQRMQRVFSAKFTPDNKYILSGSDDGNIRLWRANASERSGIKSARQRTKLEYDQALVKRYSHMPDIKRIKRQRHVPRTIKKAREIKREELSAIKRREENVRKHSKKSTLAPRQSERAKMILTNEK